MSHLSLSWERRRDLAAQSFVCPLIGSLQNSLIGGEQGEGGEWSGVCWQRSGPLPKTRKPDVLFTLGETQMFGSQSTRRFNLLALIYMPVYPLSSAPVWNHQAVNFRRRWNEPEMTGTVCGARKVLMILGTRGFENKHEVSGKIPSSSLGLQSQQVFPAKNSAPQ